MNNFDRVEILNNLNNSDLIASVKIWEDRRAYVVLTAKANANGSDKRNEVYVNLENGVMSIKNLANGEYRTTGNAVAHLVNDWV